MYPMGRIVSAVRRSKRSTYLFGVVSLVCASCGAASTSASSSTSNTIQSKNRKVNLLYAGSLVATMTDVIGPAFEKNSSFAINGYPGGSVALAQQIKDKLRKADVFLSASPSVNKLLMGPANGNYVSWYSDYASSPLVIGYSPKSNYASSLNGSNWYKVMQKPGFRLGRTDPKLDPKGKLTIKLIQDEAAKVGDPGLVSKLLGSAENTSQIFPEETLVGRLESGQLDAGIFYENEAKMAKIPFINTGIQLGAGFTVSIINNASNLAGAEAFVNFLYSSRGQKLLNSVGLIPQKPIVHGSGVPAAVKF